MPSLSTLCEIQLGYTARGRLDPVEDGIRAIQLRDTAVEGGLSGGRIGAYRLDAIPHRYWAKPGDVLFRSRGDSNTATCLPDSFDEPAVAVMPLVILRPDTSRTNAGYLAWFINQASTQRYFDLCARGTSMRMIPVGCLAQLEVPLPSIETQKTIAALDDLARRECALAHRLAAKRQQVVTLALMDKAQHGTTRTAQNTAQTTTRSTKEGLQ
jgi:hypothetical protein